MCGIFGILNFDRQNTVEQSALRLMGRVLHHRGPDDEGYHVDGNLGLGHKRLSVIDLSSRGRQPMSDKDRRLWVTYNGEIYNHLELRQSLETSNYPFRSRTDTEVLLPLYDKHGVQCVDYLNGMFAFAIWDQVARRLFLARDPFGIKPLYYRLTADRLVFASEVKAIVALERDQTALNSRGLADYLTFQYGIGDETLFEGVNKLLPGHSMVVEQDGSHAIDRYWDFRYDKQDLTEEAAREQTHALLEDSVRLQLRSDVPVGCHLSGGIDSGSISVMASRMSGASVRTFTAGFAEGGLFDDTEFARLTADHARSIHSEIYPSPTDFSDSFERLIWFLDEPVAASGSFPQFCVSKLASESVKVVLGGQGADEVFGGYARYYLLHLSAALSAGIEGAGSNHGSGFSMSDLAPNLSQLRSYRPMMSSFLRDGIFDDVEAQYYRLIRRQHDVSGLLSPDVAGSQGGYEPYEAFRQLFNEPGAVSLLDKVLHFEMSAWLPALLQVEDRTSMAWSLESRVPFLDKRLVEFGFSLPVKTKFAGGRLKHILREAVRETIPVEIQERKDKLGFPVPLSAWFAGPLRDWLHDTLLSRRARERGILRPGAIEAAVSSDSQFDRSLWGILCLEMWCRLFLDGDAWPGESS